MSLVRTADTLADETWSNVLCFLSWHDLASASLVSKTWQALAFPHLYYTVCLTFAVHLKDLAERVTLDQQGPLSLRTHVREIIIADRYCMGPQGNSRWIGKRDHEYLIAILSQLTRLEHFSWEKIEVLGYSGVMDKLRTGCPNLKSIHWYIDGYEINVLAEYHDYYVKMLDFKNLSHFSLHLREILLEYEGRYGDPIAGLVRASPDLKTFDLDINVQGSGESRIQWPLDELLTAIGFDACPSLSTFRAAGSITPNWVDLFASPDSSPVYKFFSRHPKLHSIGLGWASKGKYNKNINPSVMEMLFPSLGHIEAPSFFCAPILASSLANALESLTILDNPFGQEEESYAIAEQARSLPKLKKLGFPEERLGFEAYGSMAVAPLKRLLSRAPNLEELELRSPLNEPVLLEVLKLVPNLRTLSIRVEVLKSLQDELGVSKWQECIPVLAQTCPLLTCMSNEGHWIIQRGTDGRVNVSESARPYCGLQTYLPGGVL